MVRQEDQLADFGWILRGNRNVLGNACRTPTSSVMGSFFIRPVRKTIIERVEEKKKKLFGMNPLNILFFPPQCWLTLLKL